jgi:hypothetical protein
MTSLPLSGVAATVVWRVHSSCAARAVRRCARCDATRPFVCTHRFRLNGHHKRLDAWLLWECASCSRTWKLPVLERTPVGRIDPARLRAFESNDPDLARALAGDAALLARHGATLSPSDMVIDGLVGDALPASDVEIRVVVEVGVIVRLDRLLALGLARSRSEVARLVRSGVLVVPGGRRALRRPVPHCAELVIRSVDR